MTPGWPAEIVDPHVHQWDPFTTPRTASGRARLLRAVPALPRGVRRLASRADREFLGDPRRVLRPCLPADYRRDAGDLPVRDVVHVEAEWRGEAPLAAVDETRWVEALPFGRDGAPRLAAVVARVDPRWPDAASVLDAHAEAGTRLRGVRCSAAHHPDPGVRDFTDDPHLLRDPAFRRGFAAVAARGLSFELWLYSHQLPDALALVAEFPETTFVLDHYATPVGLLGPRGRHTGRSERERRDLLARWHDAVAALAAHRNVVAKHSGLGMPLLGADGPGGPDGGPDTDRLAPLVRGLHDAFGPERTMWASNYPMDRPVQTIPASARVLLDVLGDDARPDLLFGGVARRVYRLDAAAPDEPPPSPTSPTSRAVVAPSRRPGPGLAGRVVLVTGAAGGIGAATAHRLVARGARVVWADLDAGALADATADLGGAPLRVTLDVTDPASCAAAVAAALERHGRLDMVWANAGVSAFGPVATLDPERWSRVVEVNLLGAHRIVRAALPAVIEHRGYVAFTASWASFAHSPGHSAYSASKAGIEALANSLRTELDGLGVGVGVFHPGWTATPMVTDKQRTDPAFTALLESLPGPLRRITPVDELADVLADAFARRASKVVHPRVGWGLHAARALLPTRPLTAGARAVAPRIARLHAESVAAPHRTRTTAPPEER